MPVATAQPTDDDNEELLLSCRYGDLDDVKQFVDTFGAVHLSNIRDNNGNTILHMSAGNGHTDILDYILPLVSPALLAARNSSGSTALHWAVFNSHLDAMKKLVQLPGGGGNALIDIKNAAGRSPLAEAEMAAWEEGTSWLAQQMSLDGQTALPESEGQEVEEDSSIAADPARKIEVEIKDADGRMARMSLEAS